MCTQPYGILQYLCTDQYLQPSPLVSKVYAAAVHGVASSSAVAGAPASVLAV
eukprot:SAG31_NODE_30244_length_383_cov_2.362676_1_plen_51_part_10